jgi:hypothetical protein
MVHVHGIVYSVYIIFRVINTCPQYVLKMLIKGGLLGFCITKA